MMRTGVIGGELGYRILKRIAPNDEANGYCDGSAYRDRSKLEALFGPELWDEIAGCTVLDFGCGGGDEAVEMAQRGAARVIGVDIREAPLERARRVAREAGVGDRCVFTTHCQERVDVILSIDGFEHYADPDEVLRVMAGLVRPDGHVAIAFGPPWLHPLGGHLFSVFPWAHLLFTERALIRWRSAFKSDGATRFGEVEGGLNQMTVRRFRSIVAHSPFRMDRFEAVPIRKIRLLANPLTREWFTSLVRCRLVPRAEVAGGTVESAQPLASPC